MPIIKSKFILEREKNQKLESGQGMQVSVVGRKPDLQNRPEPSSARTTATRDGAGDQSPRPRPAPAIKPEPCQACGCGVQWQDRRGIRHCRGCDDYLSRRQVDSFWLLILVDEIASNEIGNEEPDASQVAWQWEQRGKDTFEPIHGPPPGFTAADWDLHRQGKFEDHKGELWDFWTEERSDPATGQPVRWSVTQRAGIRLTPPGLSCDIFTGEIQEFVF